MDISGKRTCEGANLLPDLGFGDAIWTVEEECDEDLVSPVTFT